MWYVTNEWFLIVNDDNVFPLEWDKKLMMMWSSEKNLSMEICNDTTTDRTYWKVYLILIFRFLVHDLTMMDIVNTKEQQLQ